ncbi:cysteine hydrolase [Opitutaceae bacterium TAV4]|nr:cysteine hydrolase [Opitutaceae bacterium TAV4]RRK00673.1 cysteine hydrolase [Opitutaceae bacterium TAV3]
MNTAPAGNWRTAYRSFYYETLPADGLPDIVLPSAATALLLIDLQRGFYDPAPPPAGADAAARAEYLRWSPYRERMARIVLPNTQRLLARFRADPAAARNILYVRITSLTTDGRDRSLSHARPGFNNLHFPPGSAGAEILPEVAPLPGEPVIGKTTDSALTGTHLRLLLANLGIRHVVVAGIFTDQCVSGTVRSLADESFNVVVVDDACAAATDDLHRHELTIINNLYCQVLTTGETLAALAP